jgi:hypothetical protein
MSWSFQHHEKRARAADDVVAVIVCKPTRRVQLVHIQHVGAAVDHIIQRGACRLVPRVNELKTAVLIRIWADQPNLISSCKIFALRAEKSEIGARYVRSEQTETFKEKREQ